MANKPNDLYVFIDPNQNTFSSNTKRVEVTICTRGERDDYPRGLGTSVFDRDDWRTGYNFLKVSILCWKDQPNWTPAVSIKSTDNLGGEEMPSLVHTVEAHKRIRAAMAKIEALAGASDSAGAFVTRFASAIKAKGLIRLSPNPDVCGKWQVLDTSHIGSVVNGIFLDFLQPAQAVA